MAAGVGWVYRQLQANPGQRAVGHLSLGGVGTVASVNMGAGAATTQTAG